MFDFASKSTASEKNISKRALRLIISPVKFHELGPFEVIPGVGMGLVSYDANGDQSLLGAVDWLRGLILGSIGTTVAILAVAGIGLLMLSGRLPIRRGGTTVLGCFILFSAGTIANGLLAGSTLATNDIADPVPAPAYEPTVPTLAPYDPYEGAAAPVRPQHDLLE